MVSEKDLRQPVKMSSSKLDLAREHAPLGSFAALHRVEIDKRVVRIVEINGDGLDPRVIRIASVLHDTLVSRERQRERQRDRQRERQRETEREREREMKTRKREGGKQRRKRSHGQQCCLKRW